MSLARSSGATNKPLTILDWLSDILRSMKFFIPAAADPVAAERVYDAIVTFNSAQLKATISPKRIYKLDFAHEGRSFTATVGEVFPRLREKVVAILFDTTKECYLICTASRGVARGEPYFSGHEELRNIEYFE